jgi:citrate lyase beta subunit
MRHFHQLGDADRQRLFVRAPEPFEADADTALLANALGATLYCPGTRPSLATDLARRSADGVVSFVVCLEDSVADDDVSMAEDNAVRQLSGFHRSLRGVPAPAMVFVRVRTAAQIELITRRLGAAADALTGFVLPKFTEDAGGELLDAVVAAAEHVGRRLYAMPVLESPEMIFAESRTECLLGARALLDKYREHVLAVRIGATDFASVYGLRRARDVTTYDVRVLAQAIGDIVNVFARADGAGYVVTGPVWEYFPTSERLFKPQLRISPFVEHDERRLRAELIANDLDGLIREVVLDRANGLVGKSVIHPSHVPAVHALCVVSQEEYADAADILSTRAAGGASASSYGNKMNESKPHTAWAARTMLRARVFGVARAGVSFVDLLAAGLQR